MKDRNITFQLNHDHKKLLVNFYNRLKETIERHSRTLTIILRKGKMLKIRPLLGS